MRSLDHSEKLSISIPQSLAFFVEEYKKAHRCYSRSQVVEHALRLLKEKELEQAYQTSAEEGLNVSREFDSTLSDGLNDETW